MPYKRQLRSGIVWMASYYVPNELLPESRRSKRSTTARIKEPAASAGYPNTEKAAAQLEQRRKREIAAGTYSYEAIGEHTADTWLREWTESRGTRYKQGEQRRVELHFLTFRDFKTRALSEFRSADFRDWARHGKDIVARGVMSSKNFWNAYGVVHGMFEAAVLETKIPFNPCVVDAAKDMPAKRKRRGRKYEESEVQELCWCEPLPADVRMLLCLLAFSGERVGEGCGHIWAEWDRSARPLTALTVEYQYKRRPLKTSIDLERPRRVPVHHELEAALAWWWSDGWAAFYGRAPRLNDPIIPNVFKRGHHTEKSIYHRARGAFDAAAAAGAVGATWKAHHALRHAFITALVGRGASPAWVERITHNASGVLVEVLRAGTVDHYTHTEWQPLCDAITKLPWRRQPAEVVRLPVAVNDVPPGDDDGPGGGHKRGHRFPEARSAEKSATQIVGVCEGVSASFPTVSRAGPDFKSLLPLHSEAKSGSFVNRVAVRVATLEDDEGAEFETAVAEDAERAAAAEVLRGD